MIEIEGPAFAAPRIVAGDPRPQDDASIHSEKARRRFKQALKSG